MSSACITGGSYHDVSSVHTPLQDILRTKTLKEILIEDKAIAGKEKEKSARWFHGKISREAAVRILGENGNTEGLFLVRESASAPGDLVLSIIHDFKPQHFRIYNRGDFHYQVSLIAAS